MTLAFYRPALVTLVCCCTLLVAPLGATPGPPDDPVVKKVTPAGKLQPKAQQKKIPMPPMKVEPKKPQRILTTQLKIVEGGGEFEFLRDEITVLEAVPVKLQWTTSETDATTGHWEVKNVTAGGVVVANGVASPAPQPGHHRRVLLSESTFLSATPPPQDTTFAITIRPYATANAPAGSTSNTVYVKQLAKENYAPPTDFGDGARFPALEIVSIHENVRQVPLTQLYSTHATVKLRVSNPAKQKTDPMWLTVKDHSLLFRQAKGPVSLPPLGPGTSTTLDVRLEAVLPPAQSQTPQAQQVRQWRRTYADRCGPEFRALLEWRGPQSQTPLNAHRNVLLAMEGWGDYTRIPPSVPICDGSQCVKLCDMEKKIREQLDGSSVGYAYVVGGKSPKFGSGGKARTAADGNAVDFTTKTPITVASVSKWITAIGAMRVVRQAQGVDIDDAVGPFFPDDWNVGNYFGSVTFAQLLGHRSGIKDYGNVKLDDAKLETFFEQPVDSTWDAACTGSDVKNPANAVNPNQAMTRCYSNYNFAIFRLLLPRVAGLPVDPNPATRPQTFANQYETLVRQNVFERVGQTGTGCRPNGSSPHAFAYKYPGDQPGKDWGDVRLECGAAGWYVSAEDMAKVLFSLAAKDGKILAETSSESQLDDMRTRRLGVDNGSATFMEKNGGWGAGGRLITTSAAIFGPTSGPQVIAVLFVNSDIKGSASSARQVLVNAYNQALFSK